MEAFREIFADLPDPRDCTAQHDLTEMMFIALVASLCGAQDCSEMAEFGVAKEPLFRQFLTLKHGIPSHDTFSRLFRHLNPQAFAEVFQRFMAAFGAAAKLKPPQGVVAIDGKSLRRAYEAGRAHMPKMMVSAWGAETRMVLGQSIAPDGNEVAGALELLKLLTLPGCVVTADALHCHRAPGHHGPIDPRGQGRLGLENQGQSATIDGRCRGGVDGGRRCWRAGGNL